MGAGRTEQGQVVAQTVSVQIIVAEGGLVEVQQQQKVTTTTDSSTTRKCTADKTVKFGTSCMLGRAKLLLPDVY